MENTLIYKQKRKLIDEEQEERLQQLREKRARRIKIQQQELEVIEKLYNDKKQKIKEQVDEEHALYRRKRDALLQEYDAKKQMLEYSLLYPTEENLFEERIQPIVARPPDLIVYDELYDDLHDESIEKNRVSEPADVVLKQFGNKECIKILIDDQYNPHLVLYKRSHLNENVVATFEGYTGPNTARNTARNKEWASKHVLLKIISFMVCQVTKKVVDLIPQIFDGKIVNFHFKHCEPKCPTNKLVYKNKDGECFHVYFATVFNHIDYKKIIQQKLEERFPDMTITIHRSGCIISS